MFGLDNLEEAEVILLNYFDGEEEMDVEEEEEDVDLDYAIIEDEKNFKIKCFLFLSVSDEILS